MAQTKHSGSHLKPWNPCSADTQAMDRQWLNAGVGPGLELPDPRPAAPPAVTGGSLLAEPSFPTLGGGSWRNPLSASSSLCWVWVRHPSFLGSCFVLCLSNQTMDSSLWT